MNTLCDRLPFKNYELVFENPIIKNKSEAKLNLPKMENESKV